MSILLDFYRDQTNDSEGRLLSTLWGWKDNQLELTHDFIQWMFPLPEPSRFNFNAPLLTDEDIAGFRGDPLLRGNLRKSFERILSFLGLALSKEGRVVEAANFAARAPQVWDYANHNWLRITRILKSVRLLGLEAESQALYAWLTATYKKRRFPIPADTFQFWTEAAQGLPFHA
jgi:hypothetical protein